MPINLLKIAENTCKVAKLIDTDDKVDNKKSLMKNLNVRQSL